jgi:hypothetical protein
MNAYLLRSLATITSTPNALLGERTSPPALTSLVHLSLASSTRAQYLYQMGNFAAWIGSDPSLRTLPVSPESVYHSFECYLLHLAHPPRPSTARILLSSWAHLSLLGVLPASPQRVHWSALSGISSLPPAALPRPRIWFDPHWLNALPAPTEPPPATTLLPSSRSASSCVSPNWGASPQPTSLQAICASSPRSTPPHTSGDPCPRASTPVSTTSAFTLKRVRFSLPPRLSGVFDSAPPWPRSSLPGTGTGAAVPSLCFLSASPSAPSRFGGGGPAKVPFAPISSPQTPSQPLPLPFSSGRPLQTQRPPSTPSQCRCTLCGRLASSLQARVDLPSPWVHTLLGPVSLALSPRVPPSGAPHLAMQFSLALCRLQLALPHRLNDSAVARLLDALSTAHPEAAEDDYNDYQRLKYRPPSPAALAAGLGSAGLAVLPSKLWTSHNLPLSLPLTLAPPTARPPRPPYLFLTVKFRLVLRADPGRSNTRSE